MSLSRSLLWVSAIACFVPGSSVLADEPTTLQPVEQQQLTTNGDCSVSIDSYNVSGMNVNFRFTVGCSSSGFQAQIYCGAGGVPGTLSRFPGFYTFDMTCPYTTIGAKTITVSIPNVGISDSITVNI